MKVVVKTTFSVQQAESGLRRSARVAPLLFTLCLFDRSADEFPCCSRETGSNGVVLTNGMPRLLSLQQLLRKQRFLRVAQPALNPGHHEIQKVRVLLDNVVGCRVRMLPCS